MRKASWLVLVLVIVEFVWLWQTKKLEKIMDLFKNKIFQTEIRNISEKVVKEIAIQPIPSEIPTRTILVPTPTIIKKTVKTIPTPDNEPWGVAKQVDEVTWTMKVGEDEKMATPQEVLTALNNYRQRYGSQNLTWDSKLGDYAQSRAKYLNSIKNVDKHEGFNNFVKNEDGFNKLGFTMLGENISYGYKLNGVHIIEWMYAGDEPHNKNQLDNRWNYVGIGVDGLATCLIFGTGKM
ncbi:MAG: CAP domain-containing protein [Candidatus Shapirobacteria bacterium]|nr:CAP domain-containing protein [Candidatus Shapirobacteria bacterium]